MSLIVTLAADILVAILLVATIVSSVRLSRRITKLKADEAALRQTIGDLVMASSTAERAIVGLRATLDECDRTLADRLSTAERYAGRPRRPCGGRRIGDHPDRLHRLPGRAPSVRALGPPPRPRRRRGTSNACRRRCA